LSKACFKFQRKKEKETKKKEKKLNELFERQSSETLSGELSV
jgi:hypothetical protein